MSVQFPAIEQLSAPRLGLAWLRYRGEFPEIEQKPPIPRTLERFEPPAPGNVDIQFERPLLPTRLWFLSEDGTRLIQLQRDRFIFNWRKLDTQIEYPHYDRLRDQFILQFETFLSFLAEEGLERPEPDQVELTYVNHIPAAESERTGRAPLERYVRLWAGVPDGTQLPSVEQTAFGTQFVVRRGTVPLGRLYIEVQSRVFRTNHLPLYHLQLTARGGPFDEPGLGGVLGFLDEAHVWIVRAFTDVTTEEMHREWQRQR